MAGVAVVVVCGVAGVEVCGVAVVAVCGVAVVVVCGVVAYDAVEFGVVDVNGVLVGVAKCGEVRAGGRVGAFFVVGIAFGIVAWVDFVVELDFEIVVVVVVVVESSTYFLVG